MIARLRSWWRKARKPLEIAVLLVGSILVMALLVVIVLAYVFNVNVPGLRGKTLWDWLQLLIIPAVLAVGGYLFNYTTSRYEREATQVRDKTERDIASDNQREAALQAYLDKLSELLLVNDLRESTEDAEVRKIARVRTLTVLRRLDAERKGSVLRFLHESGLIDKDKRIIDLSDADLDGAYLGEANLSEADLSEAILLGAKLSGANLSAADLSNAAVTPEQLNQARSLKDTILPDGSKHP